MYKFRNPSTSNVVIDNNINKLGDGPSQLLVLPPLLPKTLPALLDWVDLPSLAGGVTGTEGGIGLLLLGGGGNGGPCWFGTCTLNMLLSVTVLSSPYWFLA